MYFDVFKYIHLCVSVCVCVYIYILYVYTHGFSLLEQKLAESNLEIFKGGLGMLCGWKRERIFTYVENITVFALLMLFTNFVCISKIN